MYIVLKINKLLVLITIPDIKRCITENANDYKRVTEEHCPESKKIVTKKIH